MIASAGSDITRNSCPLHFDNISIIPTWYDPHALIAYTSVLLNGIMKDASYPSKYRNYLQSPPEKNNNNKKEKL